MASLETWTKLKYFKANSQTDSWGDVNAISDDLLLKLDDFRHYIQSPVIVTAGVSERGHSTKSFHYKENGACAVDIIIPQCQLHPIDLIMEATRFGFTGIGYYPHWKWRDKIVGGLHLDVRPLPLQADNTLDYRHSRWLGVMRDGKQIYIPMTFDNVMKHYEEVKNENS